MRGVSAAAGGVAGCIVGDPSAEYMLAARYCVWRGGGGVLRLLGPTVLLLLAEGSGSFTGVQYRVRWYGTVREMLKNNKM